jgi:dihydrofolate reductase
MLLSAIGMKRVTLFTACSIDGFIARPDGDLDWLDAILNPDKTDHGYNEMLANTSCIIMGRKTYAKLLGFGIEWPYPEIKTYVATFDSAYETVTPNTEILTGDIASSVKKIRSNQEKDIWLAGGGQLVTFFLNHSLIDRMIISVIPIILGDGIRLFPDNPKETNWVLTGNTSFSTGIVNLTWEKLLNDNKNDQD